MSAGQTPVVYQFGEFTLDATSYELRRAGARVHLARQPMELLLLLTRRAGALVTRDEIAKHLWKEEVFVDVDAGIQTAILKIRQALNDTGRAALVETVPGKGYRFVAPFASVRGATAVVFPSTVGDRAAMPFNNLPAERTKLIGRHRELVDVPRLVAASPLVTLIGAGGVGKTRLALRVAAALTPQFRDGVWLVDLGTLCEPDLVADTIARAVGLREQPGVSAQDVLRAYLATRELLLVLDTCEHVIKPCADIIDDLLRSAAGLRVLATSREALSVPGEARYRVPSLGVPAESSDVSTAAATDAVRLFVERARSIEPEFSVTPAGSHRSPASAVAVTAFPWPSS